MYASSNAVLLNKYQSDSVMTASPVDLIIMLYEALIKQVKLGDIFMEQGDFERCWFTCSIAWIFATPFQRI